MKKIVLISVLAAGLWACKKENIGIKEESEVKLASYFYDETKLMDPWNIELKDSLTLLNIKDFLSKKSIVPKELLILNDGEKDLCKAGDCKTGRRIKMLVIASDSTIAKNLLRGRCLHLTL
ncbi:MAG: hypothetical protein EAZ27_11960 [Cytophagales bacterium]|nr:MAG: hypothetical protein EAZ27_11960 [Cytophagales bacterium]